MAIQTVVASWDEKTDPICHRAGTRTRRPGLLRPQPRPIPLGDRRQNPSAGPAPRIIVGHGQMSEGELEKVMLKFMHHEADILVSTTIIENGLDIPLCNTILINRADRLGLSEL